MESHEARLQAIGLDATQIKNIIKGKSTLQTLLKTLEAANVVECDKKIGNLLYTASTKLTPSLENRRTLVATYIATGKIATTTQLEYALEYLEKNTQTQELKIQEFESVAGVGVVTTEADVKKAVTQYLESRHAELAQQRYLYNFTEYMKGVRSTIPFADGGLLTKELKGQIEAILGPKTAEDDKIVEESRKKKPVATKNEEDEPKKKIDDLVGRDMESLVNSEKLLAWRKANFGDQILTRFPPEPNGYLHIGHAKSIRFNFTLAQQHGGQTYLRLDDTNPEKECQEYIDNIKENLDYLGYKPFKTTYASDNFEFLYGFAVDLIKKGKAYACFLTKAESSELRKASKPSPYRDTDPAQTLKIFEGMRMGLYKENEVCLRAKIDFTNNNPTLRDPAIYRIRYTPHPHAGNKWCIYPLYDFTHCLCDSIEGISYSCCTLEFEIRRDLYYWFLEQLDLYRPKVWEFSRLNVSNTVLSKRKLHRLVFENYVDGWDDPRILTLNGLRRRGYTADSINEFCDMISVTRRGNENVIGMHVLEHCIRKDLDVKAPRTMVVLDPVLVTITNVPVDFSEEISVNLYPKNPEKGNRKIYLQKELYVERSDIRLDDHADFWGIAPGRTIGLKYSGSFKVVAILQDTNGNVSEVKLEREAEQVKAKGLLHWVSAKESRECEVRLYDYLFLVNDPNELEDYITGLNPTSKQVHKHSRMHISLDTVKREDKFQFERLGYFSVDYDSTTEHIVWNRTVTLKEQEKSKAMAEVDGKPLKQAPPKGEKKKKKE